MPEMRFDDLISRAAADVAYPPTPRLSTRVMAAITTPLVRTRSPLPVWRAAVFAALAAIVLTVLLTLAIPGSRSAVAEFFGIRGTDVQVLPTLAPGPSPTPLPAPVDIGLIATPVSLGDAARALGFTPAIPATGGAPGAAYVLRVFDSVPVAVIEFDRFQLWQLRLEDEGVLLKVVGSGTLLDDTTVGGRPARWFSGGAHIIRFVDRDGHEAFGTQRTVDTNALVWRTGYALYRIETRLSEEEARAIAATLP